MISGPRSELLNMASVKIPYADLKLAYTKGSEPNSTVEKLVVSELYLTSMDAIRSTA
jgi:hypothetical protein